MLLRRLELMGFKSFADKTAIEFGPGISAIVGPNGSGKSNITDAIRWVLGEVSARALRGQRMEDVIFGGAPGRRPLPLAEVTLVLDNTDGSLPLPYSEVSVTRRVDRAGQGDYLINRTPCRLRDVQELFAGTGLGRNAFAVVGQGEVEDLLRARPADRRATVEEAAGIARHRLRLQEGARRLEAAAAHAGRVDDLLAERRRLLGVLARQAEQARRHRQLSEELRRLELGLWAREWRALRAEREEAAAAAQAAARAHQALTEELGALAAEQRVVAGELQGATAELQAQEAACRSAERVLQAARQDAALAAGLAAAAAAESQRAQARQDELRARRARQLEARQAAGASQAQAAAALEAARLEAEEAARALAQATAERQAAAEAFAQAQSLLAACRQERTTALGGGEEALEQVRAAAREAERRLAAAEEEAARLRAWAAEAAAAVGPVEDALRRSRRAASELRSHRDALAALAEGLRGRVRVLAEVAAAGTGYAQGPRTVLAGRRQGLPAFAGVVGALGELLEVPPHLAAAIAAALGAGVQDIVCESAEAAERAIAGLKAVQGGRATFLPLDTIRPSLPPPDLRGLAGRPGALGWAADLVGYPERVRPAVAHALGRVLVAEDLRAARRLGQEAGFRIRIVTLEGEVVHPGGAITGGAVRGERPGGLLGRDQERRALEHRLQAVLADLDRAEAAARRAGASEQEAQRALAAAQAAAAQAEAAVRAASAVCQAARRELERLRAQEAELAERLRRRGLGDPAELAVREQAAAAQAAAAAQRLAAAEAEEGRRREAATAARVALATAEQLARAAAADAARLDRDLAEADAELGRAAADAARAAAEAEGHRRAEAEASRRAADAAAALQAAQERLQALQQRVRELQARGEACAARREAVERERERQGAELRRAEAALGRAEAAAAALQARLETAYGLAVDALAEVAPSERPAADRERATALRQELAALGGVRPEAVEEHRAEAEAVARLEAALEDVREARAAVLAWGRELEAVLADRYEQTLAAVRRHFAAIYARLCGGGTADLVPVASQAPEGAAAEVAAGGEGRVRPAEAPGLEVVVQPPGKQLAHLGLLSGGERTLAALALTLAFLRVRPTAFCVLDEVEAALDEANVVRCAEYLREVATATQVIVVTHQKATMQVADRLVGVTMAEPGVSQLLSVRLAG